MKLSELLNITFPELEEAMSKDELEDHIKQRQKEKFVDAMLSALHRLVSSDPRGQSIGGYAFDIARSFGVDPKEIERMYRDRYEITEEGEEAVTQQQLNQLEQYLDNMFAAVGIDVNFTRHFLDRVNDERNRRQITIKELENLFKDAYNTYGKKIAQMGPDAQAVIKDMRNDINVPFVLVWDRGREELDLIAKTVMRKKNFHTPNTELPLK